jgi:ATP-dependent Lon protease
MKFAHFVFWYLLAGIDDSESIQLNQHNNPDLWCFLRELIKLVEESIDNRLNNKSTDAESKTTITETSEESSLVRSYQTCALLEKQYTMLLRKDQQVMRALSDNMTDNLQFFSTPKLVSDLLFLSDLLKPIEKEKRNYYLSEVLTEINKNLPANVYIPIRSTQVFDFAK